MTACIRPGDRSDPTRPTGIPRGVPVPVRIIRVPGHQASGIAADFEPDAGITVEVTEYIVRRFGDLTNENLVGCSPDCATPELAGWHLGLHYNWVMAPDDLVTIWRFKYLPREKV